MDNKILKDNGWFILETEKYGVTYKHEFFGDLITIEVLKGKASICYHPMTECEVIVLTEEEQHGINQVVNYLKYGEEN